MQELIEHQTITAIVENVELAKADVRKAFDLLKGAKARLNAVLGHSNYYDTIIPSGSRWDDYTFNGQGTDEALKLITQNAWTYILAQTGLNHFMTQKRQTELREQIKNNELPPLTVENIVGTLQGLAGKIDGLLLESVKEVFEWLRPWRSELKTNQKWKVGPKVIITYGCERNYSGGFRLNCRDDGHFRALGNVFSLLDGKGVLKYPDDFYSRFNEGMKAAGRGDKHEDEYFQCKCFGNRNLHIKFKRLDLVAKLNKTASSGEELPGQD